MPLFPRDLRLGRQSLRLWLPAYDDATLESIVARHGVNEKHWPYYLEDWPATYAMADFLHDRLHGRLGGSQGDVSILDLGCGGGALACFLWLQFGIDPYCLDLNPEACALTRLNLRNHGATAKGVFCADLLHSPVKKGFELILGGEMLYAPDLLPGLTAFLSAHLAEKGEALFADARRGSAEGFTAMAQQAGFSVQRRVSGKAHIYALTRA